MLYIPYPFKRCTKCHRDLPNTIVYFRKSKGHRLRADCRQCGRERFQQWQDEHKPERLDYWRQYHDNHREKERAYSRQWNNEHPERTKENERRWRNANPDKKLQHRKRYEAKHPTGNRLIYDKWRRAHPDKVRAKAQRYRARKLAVSGEFTDKDIRRLYKAQHGKCYWCQKKLNKIYHADHVIPLNRGGSNDIGNIVISCPHCNASKSGRLPWEWSGNNGKMF